MIAVPGPHVSVETLCLLYFVGVGWVFQELPGHVSFLIAFIVKRIEPFGAVGTFLLSVSHSVVIKCLCVQKRLHCFAVRADLIVILLIEIKASDAHS